MPSQAGDTWSCDCCGMEGYRSFDEAKDHELECHQARKRQRPGSPGQSYSGMGPLSAAVAAETGGDYDSSGRPSLRRVAILSPGEMNQLDEVDELACQNLEVFEAGPELTSDPRMGPSPAQVGVRCIHCAHQPTNEYSMYFPGSIGELGSVIQMVADRHVISCPAVPRQVREELEGAFEKRRRDHEESRRSDEEQNQVALMAHCSAFCRHIGVVDKYPPQSGIVFADTNPQFAATPRHHPGYPTPGPGRSAGPRGPHPPMMAHMSGDAITATPLARSNKDQDRPVPPSAYGEREGSYPGYPPHGYASGPRGSYQDSMGVQTPHGRPDPGSEGPPPPQGGPPHHESPAAGYPSYGMSPYGMSPGPHQPDFPFFQDSSGSWACKYCSSIHPQYRDHGAIWNGPNPPPGQFIDQHLHVCRAYNHHAAQHSMPPSQGMYQGQPPGYGYSQPTPTGQYGGPPPQQGPPGWGTPGAPPMQTPQHLQYSTPHSGSEQPYYEPHPGIMGRPEDHGEHPSMGPVMPPRGMSSAPGPALTGGEMVSQHAIEYLSMADSKNFPYDPRTPDESGQLVLEEDKMLLTDYFYYLMKQLRVCRFSEADRKTRGGKREKIAVGYGGLQCIHCAEAPNARKFFWSNVDRLANSFAEIPSHVLKCRRCPNQTKGALTELKLRHPEQMSKLPRGSQKVFFRRMWRRLHDSDPKSEGTPSAEEKEAGEKESRVVEHTPGEAKVEAASPTGQIEPSSSSPGTSTDESAILLERSTEEAAKALAASTSHSSPPSPTSRVLLAIPEDKEWLSDMDCFVRRNIEVFCATEHDVKIASDDRKYPVHVGQVGIRCIHCALTKEGEGARGSAVAYPYSISGVYESVREFQRLHLESCPNLPPATQEKLAGFKGSASLSSVLRKYYLLAAKALGMYDTPDGIRSGAESVPLGSSAAFAFAESASKVSEEMRRGGPPSGYIDTEPSITPLESRKRKQPDESGDAPESQSVQKEG